MAGSWPIRFQGSAAEGAANYATHQFGGIDDRCFECDSKPGHAAAFYPCGATVPREVCECTAESHWAEDKYGAETRLDCGCPCTVCQEY